MGANHVGEIARLTRHRASGHRRGAEGRVAHLGEFGSVERIVEAKSEIVRGLADGGVAILNADDERVASMSAQAPGEVLWFGVQDERALASGCSARDIGTDALDRPRFTLSTPDGAATAVRLGICGRHNVMNALAAASVAFRLGMPPARIGEVLEGLTRISPHRMAVSTVERGGASFTLIDDSFNANPDSMRAGLDGLMAWGAGEQTAPYVWPCWGPCWSWARTIWSCIAAWGEYAARCGVDAVVAVGGTADAHLDALAEAVAQGQSARKRARPRRTRR